MSTVKGFKDWITLLVSLQVMAIFVVPEAHALSKKQEFARVATEAIWANWSKPNNEAVRFLDSRYSARVRYYNKEEPKSEVMQLKREYATRWPQRDYSIAPGSLEITCNDNNAVCSVNGRVYWDVRNPAKDIRAVGLAKFTFGIFQTENSFNIVSEGGEVLANKQSSLSADNGQLEIPLGTSLSPFQDQPRISALRNSQISKAVIFCFNQGNGKLTIQQMFDCSGVWVTPKALLRCSFGSQCPALPDTLNGRATVNSLLEAENLTISSVLTLCAQDMPALPSFEQVNECKQTAKTEKALADCALLKTENKQLTEFRECIKTNTGNAQAKCITASIKDEKLEKMVVCLDGKSPEATAVNNCLNNTEVTQKLDAMRKCTKDSKTLSGSAGCISTGLPEEQKKVAECLARSDERTDSMKCLNQISPDIAKANAVMQCMDIPAGAGKKKMADCLAKAAPDLSVKVGSCVATSNREELARCMIGNTPELQAAEQLYNCASKGRDMAHVITYCTSALKLDPKTQMTLACAARANGSQSKLAGCAAEAVLPADAARYVGCAATSQGPTSFALCAATPQMNEEFRIASECAVQSAGEPSSTAACAATRLTIRELGKCITGTVGKDCFGPNNFFVKTLNDAFKDVLSGPGPNNEVVKAVKVIDTAVRRLTEEGRNFVERPLGGKDALIPKARDDLLNAVGIGGTGRKIIENPFNPFAW